MSLHECFEIRVLLIVMTFVTLDLNFVVTQDVVICDSDAVCRITEKSKNYDSLCFSGKKQEYSRKTGVNISEEIWKNFSEELDTKLSTIEPIPSNYDLFSNAIWEVSLRNNITQGMRSLCKSGLDPKTLEPYVEAKAENDDAAETAKVSKVTADQIADVLLEHADNPHRLLEFKKPEVATPSTAISKPFSQSDLVTAIGALKNKTSSGFDDVTIQQLKHIGPGASSWLLSLYNNCIEQMEIPEVWRLVKIIAILKRGRPDTEPKSYRPISLLSNTFKLFERLLLNRLTPIIEPKIMPEQSGARPNRTHHDTVLQLAQYIEKGYESDKMTSIVIVDPSAAADCVNVDRLLAKLTTLTNDNGFINILGKMLRNRRIQIHLHHKTSKWRTRTNGLSQGSVLSSMLYNVYSNDLPSFENIQRFLYVDDLILAVQTDTISEAEEKFKQALPVLEQWYLDNALRPNPLKTKCSVFHKNRADLKLNLTWQAVPVTHKNNPVYLGVTLDRELKFKDYVLDKLKMAIVRVI